MRTDSVRDPRPVPHISAAPDAPGPDAGWPYAIPAVAQLLREGLELEDVTILVGENGSGKSTIVEGVAAAYGLNAEGGSVHARHSTWVSESPLHEHLRLARGAGASKWGYFLRAESTHGLFTYLQSLGGEQDFHARSHGESFWDMLSTSRFSGEGFFVLDEPEAGLSFDAQLRLVAMLLELAERDGTQVLLATHSPILAALPGASLYELSDAGMTRTTWEELAMVDHYRRYLEEPDLYLRYLME